MPSLYRVAYQADGTVQVADVANPKFSLTRRLAGHVDLTEGYYLGFVASEFVLSTEDTRLVRLQVTEVGAKGSATIRVSAAAAAKIKLPFLSCSASKDRGLPHFTTSKVSYTSSSENPVDSAISWIVGLRSRSWVRLSTVFLTSSFCLCIFLGIFIAQP